jgi:hypothetical protein
MPLYPSVSPDFEAVIRVAPRSFSHEQVVTMANGGVRIVNEDSRPAHPVLL